VKLKIPTYDIPPMSNGEVNLQATWKSLNTNLFPLFQSIW